MKAIQVKNFGEPDVLKLVDIDIPVPGNADVLVKIEAIGVNPVDTYVRAGRYPKLPSVPYIPGKDIGGVIVKVGAGVKKWKEGDRIYSVGTLTGGYAEYTVCHQSQIFSLPENMDFTHGAAIGTPGAAAWRALYTRARATQGDLLLIHGASGSVGMVAIQLALSAGLKVHGSAGSEEGLMKIRQAGVHKAYNHNDPDYVDEIVQDLDGRGYNIILEMLANINLTNDLSLLDRGGRVVIFGSRGEISIDPRATMAKETAILGMSLFNSTEEEMKEAQVGLYQQMSAGHLLPEIAAKLALDDAGEAHVRILESGNCGKLLLIP